MREITSDLRTEIVESDDGTKRFSLKKVWDENKPSLTIVMLVPSSSGLVPVDVSTGLVLSNCYRLGYGSVTIVNLFATINDFALKHSSNEDMENMEAIIKAGETASTIVYGAGTGKQKNKLFAEVQRRVLLALKPYEDKLYCLCDDNGRSKYLHPLSPRVREWNLAKLKINELINMPDEGKTKDAIKKKKTNK